MGRDKHRSSSRSPDRRYRKDDSGDDSGDHSRSGHKESSRYRNSDEERSDDEYEQKKERKRREKELRKREKEERQRERGEEHGSRSEGYSEEYSQSRGYGSSEYVSGEYRPQPGPYARYQPQPAPSGQDYGAYGQQQQPYYQEQPPYGSGGEYQRGVEYGYGQPPPQPQYSDYRSNPSDFPPTGYGQSPHNPSPAYDHHTSPPPMSGYGAQGGYQGQYQPPSQGYQGQCPPSVAPASVDHPPLSPTGALGYDSRPQYSTEGANSGNYKPQAHSIAQDACEESETTFISDIPTEQAPTQGGSVLDSFTKGLSEALHGYARNIFPATSTYSNSATGAGWQPAAPEATTGNRFESFAPVRNGNAAKWYVDGKDYMYAVSVALENARETIWILDCKR
jgi:hypothetical protein